VGLSEGDTHMSSVSVIVKGAWLAYTWPTITFAVRLHPAYVLTAAVAPFGKDFASAFKPVSGAAAYPEENEGRVCGKRRKWKLL
jgi:hypothetical protein